MDQQTQLNLIGAAGAIFGLVAGAVIVIWIQRRKG